MSYFDGIREGDKIWTIQEGWTEVTDVTDDAEYPIETTNESFTMDGKYILDDAHQSAFWSDPQIVAPPRPKRYKKVKVEVRPYLTRYNPGKMVLASEHEHHMDLPWCGPTQVIEVDVDDD